MGLQKDLGNAVAVASIDAATSYCAKMESLLSANSWLAGSFSFADIAFYMAALFGERQGAPITGATPRLLEWRTRMTRRPAVRAVVSAMASWLNVAGRPVPAFMLDP